jgi:hypothetical protein
MWAGGSRGGVTCSRAGLNPVIPGISGGRDVRFHDRGPPEPDIRHAWPTIMAGPGSGGAKRHIPDALAAGHASGRVPGH